MPVLEQWARWDLEHGVVEHPIGVDRAFEPPAFAEKP
jgi:hypothetical protein